MSPLWRARSFIAVALCIALSDSACSIARDANIAVFADRDAGVGEFSSRWTRAFFAWLETANADLVVSYVERAEEINTLFPGGCILSDAAALPSLRLWVQPGGSADNQSAMLGPGGRDNLLNFAAAKGRGHYMGTCAGSYFAAGTYWWGEAGGDTRFFPNAWMPHWTPTVEGPIRELAVYPDYTATQLSNGLTQVYWGGPALGYEKTTAALPDGATLLSTYADAALPRGIPAAWIYRGAYVDALLLSPHPEAQAGVGVSCAPPLPPGCITKEQQLANWQWLAAQINELTGSTWVVPDSL